MRRTSWLASLLIVTLVSVAGAADTPDKDKTAKTAPPKTAAKAKPKAPKGASTKAAPGAQPTATTRPANDPRATSLFHSAQNLESTGKNPGAIGLYRDVMIKYPDSPEARQAEGRIKALGGKVPAPSEINPAPPPEEAKFVRAPKPKYASQKASRAALNEAIGGMVGGAMSQPAAAGGYGTQGGYR
jgi:hypothetical protein